MVADGGETVAHLSVRGGLGDELSDKLVQAINQFKKGFAATGGGSVVPDEHVDALDEGDLEKESVKVRKPAPKKK